MKHKDGKLIHDKSTRIVPMTVLLIVLCGFSFYLGKIYCPEKDRILANDTAKAVESSKAAVPVSLQVKSVSFPDCGIDYQDYTPCTDPKVLFVTKPMLRSLLGLFRYIFRYCIYFC